eukprot:797460_1
MNPIILFVIIIIYHCADGSSDSYPPCDDDLSIVLMVDTATPISVEECQMEQEQLADLYVDLISEDGAISYIEFDESGANVIIPLVGASCDPHTTCYDLIRDRDCIEAPNRNGGEPDIEAALQEATEQTDILLTSFANSGSSRRLLQANTASNKVKTWIMANYLGLDPLLRFKAYRRHSGKKSSVPAIGYGHIGPDVTKAHIKEGRKLTQPQAEAQLDTDITSHVAAVNAALDGTPVTQYEFDGLVLHAYRIGIANFRESGVLKGFKEGKKWKAYSAWLGEGGNVKERSLCFPNGYPRVPKVIRIRSINFNIPLVPVDITIITEKEEIPSPYEAKDLLCIAPTCETSGEGLVKSHKCQCMQTECDGAYCNRLYGFIDDRLKSALDYDDEYLCRVSGSVCCCHCPNCEEIRA